MPRRFDEADATPAAPIAIMIAFRHFRLYFHSFDSHFQIRHFADTPPIFIIDASLTPLIFSL